MNRFLLKWLRFCTFQGHIFIPGITPTLDEFQPVRVPNGHRHPYRPNG